MSNDNDGKHPNNEVSAKKQVEKHPFPPFLPAESKILFLGSFPPAPHRWCMPFYYPNFTNDMWRILGLIFFDDSSYFVDKTKKKYKQEAIIDFANQYGLAFYDTAQEVIRTKGTAADKDLEIIKPTDIPTLLLSIPQCQAIVTTGEKATATACQTLGIKTPPSTGKHITFRHRGKELTLHRLPSTSRAYPMKLEVKAQAYKSIISRYIKIK